MPSSIASFGEFWLRLKDAQQGIDQLAQRDPDPMFLSIQRQLKFVEQWTGGGRRPAQQDLDKLTFGQMASRAVDDVDRHLATELYELASYLIYWPPNQPIRQ